MPDTHAPQLEPWQWSEEHWRELVAQVREGISSKQFSVLKNELRRQKFRPDRCADPIYWRPRPDAPFTRFSLVPIRTAHEKTTEPVGADTAAEFLWRNLITPFGRSADECREQVRSLPGVTPDSMVIAGQTFGLLSQLL